MYNKQGATPARLRLPTLQLDAHMAIQTLARLCKVTLAAAMALIA
jgi:hypothetical protein